MACNYNIKVVEGNEFALLLPLKKRTYVASVPIDEDIVYADLQDCVVKIGGVEYAHTIEENGVQVIVPATLAKGTYDIVLTAEYHGSDLRAAYFDGLTIVAYNQQSSAHQYIAGSPIVAEAAFVIGGTLTDAELEALKAEYREKIAAAEEAEAAAEAAKEEYDQKAEMLDGVAQEQTLTQGVQTLSDKIDNIDIDTTTLAKQGTNAGATLTATQTAATNAYASAEAAKTAIGTPASGQPATLFAAIAASGGGPATALEAEVESGKAEIAQAIEDKGGMASAAMTLGQLADAIDSVQVPTQLKLETCKIYNNTDYELVDMGGVSLITQTNFNFKNLGAVKEIRNLPSMPNISTYADWFQNGSSLQKIKMKGFVFKAGSTMYDFLATCPSLEWVDLSFSKYEGVGDFRSITYQSPIKTLVGDMTYDEVITPQTDNADGVYVFGGIEGTTYGYQWSYSNDINRQSLRAIINGLADRTGEASQTLNIGATNLARLSADDIAVATRKNWTIS